MGMVTRTVIDDEGVEIAPNSERAYRIIEEALRVARSMLEEASPVLPDVLRDEYQATMSKIGSLAGDAGMIASDMGRYKGDHAMAMADRAARKRKR